MRVPWAGMRPWTRPSVLGVKNESALAHRTTIGNVDPRSRRGALDSPTEISGHLLVAGVGTPFPRTWTIVGGGGEEEEDEEGWEEEGRDDIAVFMVAGSVSWDGRRRSRLIRRAELR